MNEIAIKDTVVNRLNSKLKNIVEYIPLRVVLIVPFISLTIITVGFIGYLSFHNGQQAVNDVTTQLRSEITARIEQRLETFLGAPHLINQFNNQAILHGLLDINDQAALERYFLEQVQIYDSVSAIYFGNTEGGLALGERESTDGSLYTITTENFTRGVFNKYATDSQGNHTELVLTFPGFDARTRPWYKGAVETGQATWSDVYILFTGQDMVISPSRPVYNQSGDLSGVVAIDIFLSHISNFLQTLKIGKTGKAFIIERTGLLVASSTDEKPFTSGDGDEEQRRLYANESNVALIQATADILVEQFGDFNAIDSSQQFDFEIDGQREFAQVVPFQDGRGIDWLIVIAIPESDFMAQINQNTYITLWLSLIALFGAVGLGYLTANWVAQPILDTKIAAKKFADGMENIEIQSLDPALYRIGELKELTSSFNYMGQQLQAAFAALSQSEQQYRELVERANCLIVRIDMQGHITFINEFGLFFLGYTEDELIGQSVIGTIIAQTESSGRDLQEMVASILKHPQRYKRNENENMTKDGRKLWIIWSNEVIYDSGGNPIGLLCIGQDNTARRQAEHLLKSYNQKLELQVAERTAELTRTNAALQDQIKERKLTDAALRKSEANLSHAQEIAKLGYWTWDLRTNELVCSDGLFLIYDFEPGTRNDRFTTFENIIHPDDFEFVQEKMREKKSDEFTYRIITKKGIEKIVSVQQNKHFDEKGNAIQLFGIVRDVTEQETNKKKLLAEKEFSKAIIDTNHTIIVGMDRNHITRIFSKGAEKITGYSRSEVLGKDWHSLFLYYENQDELDKAWKAAWEQDYNSISQWEAVQKDNVYTITGPLRVRNGDTKTILWQNTKINIGDDESKHLHISIGVDVTEQKQAEKALQESEKKYQDLFDLAPDMYISVDAKTACVLECNLTLANTLGYGKEEVIGRPVLDLYTPKSAQYAKEHVFPMFAKTGEIKGEELQAQRKDGGVIEVLLKVTAVRDAGGNIVQSRSSWRDITGLKQVEEELRKAKEVADAANIAKSVFLANMSHELRTPLNAILGFAQIMTRSRTLPRKHEENLAIICRSGEHLLTLINQVLDLSKIEAGRITLDESDFDLHNMLSELEDMFRIQADKKALQLVFNCSEKVPRYIRTDEIRLRQVLINLLNNALKFTKEGGVAVRTGIADSEDRKSGIRELKFEIKDTGPGIASEETDKVFEAFVQTETGKQTGKGTGLGLPISKKFVQLMGGDITVRSEPGCGTTFTFDIQAGIADAAEITAAQFARRAVALEPGQPRYRILIADDKSDNRKLLVKMLHPFGFILREAVNGREAVEIWNQWKPHLIWMDIQMPVMNGYEAVRKIRDEELIMKKEIPETRHTAIIAVSANAYEEERDVAISKQCDDFLRKPFRETAIFDLMIRHSDIRFVYENEETDSETQRAERKKALTPEALATLPDDVIAEFRKAVLIADLAAAMRLCEQIRSENEPLADALAELVSAFRFDTLQELFGKEEKNEPQILC
ncbi:PAS domain S-box protein [Desulfococcaceae bacterium HSG9]|nr:PAS domain S-box protein [Desulfococcaceae bacterium HSG9]